jgi:hypothetical protein
MPGIRLSSALAAVIVLSAACGKPLTVEQQIIAAIRDMEALVEAGERRPFMGYLTEDFTAQRGSMNRDQLRALLIMQLNRYRRLEGRLFPIRVAETGEETATADFRALVTGGPGWIPESGQVYEFKTRWRLVDGEWLLYAADWEPVPLEAVL